MNDQSKIIINENALIFVCMCVCTCTYKILDEMKLLERTDVVRIFFLLLYEIKNFSIK